ncbi:MAG: hypothetical protein LUD47_02335 [Clostridia bacterium]|nr:hypothetical protein [Clostridia bacterium]
MAKIRIMVKGDVKKKALATCAEIGISLSDAVSPYLSNVADKGYPSNRTPSPTRFIRKKTWKDSGAPSRRWRKPEDPPMTSPRTFDQAEMGPSP